MSDQSLKVVSLFSGGGLMDLGFVNAGYEVVWANDVEPTAIKAYKTNLGNHIFEGDISGINTSEIPNADVIIGGFPCQPFSFSGTNEGVNDDNGKLAYQFYRLIKAKRPYAFVAENVKGLTTKTHVKFLEKFIDMLRDLGYRVQHRTLNASDYGVPQSRERVFIVGIKDELNLTYDFDCLVKSDKVLLHSVIKDVSGLPNHENTFKVFSEKAVYGGLKRGGSGGTYGMRVQGWNDVSNTLRSHIAKDGIDFVHPECGLNNKVLSYIYNKKAKQEISDLNKWAKEIVDFFHPRRLSVRECLRIQSVPDDYFFIDSSVPYFKEKFPELEVPVTAQFKVVGNGVPTLLAQKVAELLKMYIEDPVKEKKRSSVVL